MSTQNYRTNQFYQNLCPSFIILTKKIISRDFQDYKQNTNKARSLSFFRTFVKITVMKSFLKIFCSFLILIFLCSCQNNLGQEKNLLEKIKEEKSFSSRYKQKLKTICIHQRTRWICRVWRWINKRNFKKNIWHWWNYKIHWCHSFK